MRALIDAANAAGGKDNVTVVYVEGPRFATGEDTRDLRPQRVPPSPAARVAPASRVRRWRVLALLGALLLVIATVLYAEWDRLGLPSLADLKSWRIVAFPSASGPIPVKPGESISAAIRQAADGATVVVEPGEYRERLTLKSGVRVVSRVPRGASLRLPGDASETDAAVVAFDVADAELSGFRILGDAATPLGKGVVVRNSTVGLNDLEITGAHAAAVEYIGAQGGSIVAGNIHDNPGAAIIVRNGASPRIAHNAFVSNATSERAAGTLIVEAAAHPTITANTFFNLRPDAVVVPQTGEFNTVTRDNWFIPPSPPAPERRDGRGRR